MHPPPGWGPRRPAPLISGHAASPAVVLRAVQLDVMVLRTDVALTPWANDHAASQAPVGLATALIVGVPAAIGGLPRLGTLLDARVGGSKKRPSSPGACR